METKSAERGVDTGLTAQEALAQAGRGTAMAVREHGRSPVLERPSHMAWADMAEADLVEVLRSSLYPGATDASIRSVIGYCKANGLNVMLKPVHIVPMWIPEKKVDNQKVPGTGCMRDIIMPGIGHYRTQASRSGVYMGKTAPAWGPMVTYTLDNHKYEVPEWCRITVKKMVQGQVVEFTAEEYWIENYATAGRDKKAPNAMWSQRSRGQLAKVTEAQALRQAFPEFTGAETAEEMEGKPLAIERVDEVTSGVKLAEGGATQQLDRFAGNGNGGQKVEPKGEEKKAAKAAGKAQEKPQADLPTDDNGEVPKMPSDAENAFAVENKWSKGWRWLNEVMPTLGPKSRQALAEEHADLLWAVHNTSDAYKKAALEFVQRMGVKVPGPKGEANGEG